MTGMWIVANLIFKFLIKKIMRNETTNKILNQWLESIALNWSGWNVAKSWSGTNFLFSYRDFPYAGIQVYDLGDCHSCTETITCINNLLKKWRKTKITTTQYLFIVLSQVLFHNKSSCN
jgi:hypothetical protein